MTQMTFQAVRQLIADDSYAVTFQSIDQYRSALLRHFDSLIDRPNAAPTNTLQPSVDDSAFDAGSKSERNLFEIDVLDLFNGDANFKRKDGGEYTDQQVLDMWIGWSMRAAFVGGAR